MFGFFQLRPHYLLILFLFISPALQAQADVWQLKYRGSICPIQRLDLGKGLQLKKKNLPSVPVIATPPTTETLPSMVVDPPTRVGFSGSDLFVCCSRGSADNESCELTNLLTGKKTRKVVDAKSEQEIWLKQLSNQSVWPFIGLEVIWEEKFIKDAGGSTLLNISLRHKRSGVTTDLGGVSMKELGMLRLWGVRTSPDGSRFALIRHGYLGEYTDIYPVTLYHSSDLPRAIYIKAAEMLSDMAKEAKKLACDLTPASSKKK